MKDSIWHVKVVCEENGQTVDAGDFYGVAATIQAAIKEAVQLAKANALADEKNHRAESAVCIAPVAFGLCE